MKSASSLRHPFRLVCREISDVHLVSAVHVPQTEAHRGMDKLSHDRTSVWFPGWQYWIPVKSYKRRRATDLDLASFTAS